MDLTFRPSQGQGRLDIASALGLSIPVELGALLDQSATARARFWRLDDAERVGFVRHIEEADSAESREQRAMMIATSLLGGASDVRASTRSWQI